MSICTLLTDYSGTNIDIEWGTATGLLKFNLDTSIRNQQTEPGTMEYILKDTEPVAIAWSSMVKATCLNLFHRQTTSNLTLELTPKRNRINVSIVKKDLHTLLDSKSISELTPKRNHISVIIVREVLHIKVTWRGTWGSIQKKSVTSIGNRQTERCTHIIVVYIQMKG